MRKIKVLAVAVPAISVGIVGIAYAASVTINPATATASQTQITGCTSGPVGLAYGTPSDSGSGFTVSNVVVSNIDASSTTKCQGKTVYLNLTDNAGTIVATGTPTVITGTTSATSVTVNLAFSTGRTLADVKGVNLAVQ